MADCQHRDTATTARLSGRLDADAALAGLYAEVTIGTCTGCGHLVAKVELRTSRNTPPTHTTPAVVLRPRQKKERPLP